MSAASVSRASEAGATTSAGIASAVGVMGEIGALDAISGGAETGSGMGVSGSTASGGTASVFFEKSHMLRVARGTCTRGERGRRSAR